MKLAISGKGGVGKTLVAGVLAHFLAEEGFKVLAIDADPTPNLALTLGIHSEAAKKIVPVSENTQLIQSKTQTGFTGVFNLSFSVEDIIDKFSVKSPFGVNLLVMGTVRSAGTGCMCPANTVVRALLHHLLVRRKEAVVIDLEAGIEHMGRGTAERVETMIMVTEPSLKSLEISNNLSNLAKEAGIKAAYIVGNKVATSPERDLIEKFTADHGMHLLGLVPYDEQILKADRQGESPLKYVKTSEAIMSIQKMGNTLLGHTKTTNGRNSLGSKEPH